MNNFEELQKELIESRTKTIQEAEKELEIINSGKLKIAYERAIKLLSEKYPNYELKTEVYCDYKKSILIRIVFYFFTPEFPDLDTVGIKEDEITNFIVDNELERIDGEYIPLLNVMGDPQDNSNETNKEE